MSVVAIAAFASFGAAMFRRSTDFSSRAERHRLQLLVDTLNARAATASAFEHHRDPTPGEVADRRFYLHHAEAEKGLYETYHRAARFPWLAAPPDPSEPGG